LGLLKEHRERERERERFYERGGFGLFLEHTKRVFFSRINKISLTY